MSEPAELSAWRAEFPILERTTYLNSCSLGPLSRRSEAYLRGFTDRWHTDGAAGWYDEWLPRLDELLGHLAALWNARETEVALVPSVSAGLASIASALDYSRRPRVVVSDLDFPTIAYQWLAREGVEVVVVPSDDEATTDLERWRDAIDERTALVATSHAFFMTGAIQDIASISALAHQAGALMVVDGYQATGQIDVDPRALGCDIYVAGPLKWLLGGPGLAYLWVREERIEGLRPEVVSWLGTPDPFGFDLRSLDLRDDARRFSLGTPSLPTVHTALGGLEIVREVGMPVIEARVRSLTARLVDLLQDAGLTLRIAREPAARSGIVMVDLGDPERAAGVVGALAEQSVVVDARDRYVRISPHFFNAVEELERVVSGPGEAVKRAAAGRRSG